MGIRNLRRAMRRKHIKMVDKNYIAVWLMHFGHADLYPGEGASCEKCLDYINGACNGGHIPEKCMIEKSLTGVFIEGLNPYEAIDR